MKLRTPARLCALTIACLLAGCGGSGDFETAPVAAPPPPPPPVEAEPPVTATPDPAAGPVTDPQRGARLFATPAATGQLPCMDCHSDDPVVRNFGNIWAARNAPSLIERAMSANTGGMGSLRPLSSAALADTISSSTTDGIDALSVTVQGDFQRSGGTCTDLVARFSSCNVEVGFRPARAGPARGAILIRHSGMVNPVRIVLTGSGHG